MSYELSGLLPGDNGIAQTINKMIAAAKWTTQNYDMRKRAERVIASCPERDELCEVRSIFAYVLAHFHYVKDPRFLEMFKAPDAASAEIDVTGCFLGDCDDVSLYIVSLLLSIGYRCKFVVIPVPGQGDDFRHVYPMVYLPKARRWMALEATNRYQPAGWEAPQGNRRREFEV